MAPQVISGVLRRGEGIETHLIFGARQVLCPRSVQRVRRPVPDKLVRFARVRAIVGRSLDMSGGRRGRTAATGQCQGRDAGKE